MVMTARFVLILCSMLAVACREEGKTSESANSISNISIAKDLNSPSVGSLIKKIDKQLKGRFNPPGQLYQTKEFPLLYGNSTIYLDDIKEILKSSEYSFNEKLICIYGVQKLDLSTYAEFALFCLKLIRNGTIKEDLFYYVMTPIGWKTDSRFINNYENADVRNLLNEVIKDGEISKTMRERMERIRSGAVYKERLKMPY